jgi:large subunit ribosomal protein L21
MFAVIKTGGKQYLVQPGDKIEVELLDAEIGKEITFPEVLLLGDEKKTEIGSPLVKGAEVKAKVLALTKGEKLIIFKYKPKKRYKRKVGHRQKFTQVEIVSIS